MKKVIFMIVLISLALPIVLHAEWKPYRSIPTTPYSGDFTIWKGKIWQVDILSDSIYVYDLRSGEKERSIPSPGYSPYSVTVFKDTLVVSNEDEICFIGEDGNIIRTIYSPASFIKGLAPDGDYIWVADKNGEIYCISSNDGTIIKTLEGSGGRINGLAYSKGYLWTTSRYRDELYMIEPENGEVINILPSPGPYPSGIFVMDNNIYVSDFEKDSLFLLPFPTRDLLSEKIQ